MDTGRFKSIYEKFDPDEETARDLVTLVLDTRNPGPLLQR